MEQIMDNLSLIGSILLAVCGLPIAYEAWKKKESNVNALFLFTWLLGEICTWIYVVHKEEWYLTINYSFNILFIAIVLYYKYRKYND
jgi:hypothetical protein